MPVDVSLYKLPKERTLAEYVDIIARNSTYLEDIASLLRQNKAYLNAIHEINCNQLFQLEAAKSENANKLWQYGYKVFSQNEEDGIITEIFKRISITAKTFIEFGVDNGHECNTAKLLVEGWSGIWLEAQPDKVKGIKEVIKPHFGTRLTIKEARVTAENINELLADAEKWSEVDILSIDVDYNDYWLWKSLTVIKPRVIVIEYNSLWPPPISLVVPYSSKAQWDGSNYSSASLEAMTILAGTKGYSLVGCNFTGVNAFYIRNDCLNNTFIQSFTAKEHYEPVRYNFRQMLGHFNRVAPYLSVVASVSDE